MFTLDDNLPYAYKALEPFFDAQTMEIHFTKHHRGYLNKLNNLMVKENISAELSIEALLKTISSYSMGVRNNAGGFFNHNLFWTIIGPRSVQDGLPLKQVSERINEDFESFDNFKKMFAEAGMNRFGSGWVWLTVKEDKSLCIHSTPNQDNPFMDTSDIRGIPLIGLDLWEHAYYLKYQNRRADYIEAFWNIISWREVETRYEEASK